MAQRLQIDEAMATPWPRHPGRGRHRPGAPISPSTSARPWATTGSSRPLRRDPWRAPWPLPAGEEGWFGPPDRHHLQGVEESTASRGGVQSVFLDKEGQTITYLSYFSGASLAGRGPAPVRGGLCQR